MKLKKSIVAMALVASMICGSTMNLWAAEMTVKNKAVQYEEITDVEELIERAERGIDDLRDDTELKAETECNLIQSARSRAASVEGDIEGELKSYTTSQRLGMEMVDGEMVDTYAAASIVTYGTGSHSASVSGVKLVSKIYLYVYSDGRASIRMKNTSSNVSGGAQRLVMTNLVQQYTSGPQYTNGQTISYPSGTYTLSAPSGAANLWLTDSTAFCKLQDTVYMSNGASCVVKFIVNRNLNEYNVN